MNCCFCRGKGKIDSSVTSEQGDSDLLVPPSLGETELKYASVNRNGTKKLVFITFFLHRNMNFA